MSVSDTAVAAAAVARHSEPLVRDAVPADYPAIRRVIIAAYRQYDDLIARDIFTPYLADLLDLDTHARHGHLLVAEADGQVSGFGAFYPDASAQGLGWPPGWAGGRALAVHPAARGHGVARALLAACERLARESGAPVFAFHTASFMTGAIALYERLGYRRAPGVRLRHGRPLQPVRRRADHRHRLPALPGPGARVRPGFTVRVTRLLFWRIR